MTEIISTLSLGTVGAAVAFTYVSMRASHKLRRQSTSRPGISADRAK